MTSLREQLLDLETRLMDENHRRHPEKLAHLLADDFVEFGSSGRIFNKEEVLAALRDSGARDFSVEEFHIQELAPDCVLATYRVSAKDTRSLRSSIWIRRGSDWTIVFHQGTLVPSTTR